MGVEFNCLGYDVHLSCCLTVGIPQANQRSHLPLACRQSFPFQVKLVRGVELFETSGQEFSGKIIFRAASLLCECDQCSVDTITDLEGPRAGVRTSVYQAKRG